MGADWRLPQAALHERIVWRRGPGGSGRGGGEEGVGRRGVQAATGASIEIAGARVGSPWELSARDGAWCVHDRLQRVCAATLWAGVGLGDRKRRVELGESPQGIFQGSFQGGRHGGVSCRAVSFGKSSPNEAAAEASLELRILIF